MPINGISKYVRPEARRVVDAAWDEAWREVKKGGLTDAASARRNLARAILAGAGINARQVFCNPLVSDFDAQPSGVSNAGANWAILRSLAGLHGLNLASVSSNRFSALAVAV